MTLNILICAYVSTVAKFKLAGFVVDSLGVYACVRIEFFGVRKRCKHKKLKLFIHIVICRFNRELF